MAYSAIDKMRKKNEQIYGRDVGPMQPALSVGACDRVRSEICRAAFSP